MARRRVFLYSAAAWNIAEGVALIVLPGRRVGTLAPGEHARAIGFVVVAFGVLYAVMGARPIRALLMVSTVAKVIGGASGIAAIQQGRRDAVAFVSLADAAWVPGFAIAARGVRS